MRVADASTAALSEAIDRGAEALAISTASRHTDEETSQLTARVAEGSTTASGDAVDGVGEAPTILPASGGPDGKSGELAEGAVAGPSTAVSAAMERVGEAHESLTAPGYTAAIDIMSATGEAVSGLAQTDFASSCTSLLDQIGALIVVGDEIAKVRLIHSLGRGLLIIV